MAEEYRTLDGDMLYIEPADAEGDPAHYFHFFLLEDEGVDAGSYIFSIAALEHRMLRNSRQMRKFFERGGEAMLALQDQEHITDAGTVRHVKHEEDRCVGVILFDVIEQTRGSLCDIKLIHIDPATAQYGVEGGIFNALEDCLTETDCFRIRARSNIMTSEMIDVLERNGFIRRRRGHGRFDMLRNIEE